MSSKTTAEVNDLLAWMLPACASPKHIGTMEMFMDGNQWCIKTRGLCIADPRCRCGFGDTPDEAVRACFREVFDAN